MMAGEPAGEIVPEFHRSPWSRSLRSEHEGELRSVLVAILLAALVVTVADSAVLHLLGTA